MITIDVSAYTCPYITVEGNMRQFWSLNDLEELSLGGDCGEGGSFDTLLCTCINEMK